jgi:hypothetical protein
MPTKDTMTKAELQAFVRSKGRIDGGYPTLLLMADGECIDAQSARENYRQIRSCMRFPDGANPDWTPVGVDVHWEGEPITCAHSGRAIESAYGIPE